MPTADQTGGLKIMSDNLQHTINVAQDVFQRRFDETYENLPLVTSLSYDILVIGTTRDKHLQTLRVMFHRSRKIGQPRQVSFQLVGSLKV